MKRPTFILTLPSAPLPPLQVLFWDSKTSRLKNAFHTPELSQRNRRCGIEVDIESLVSKFLECTP